MTDALKIAGALEQAQEKALFNNLPNISSLMRQAAQIIREQHAALEPFAALADAELPFTEDEQAKFNAIRSKIDVNP